MKGEMEGGKEAQEWDEGTERRVSKKWKEGRREERRDREGGKK